MLTTVTVGTNNAYKCYLHDKVPQLNKTVHTSLRMGPISVCVTAGRWLTLVGGGAGL